MKWREFLKAPWLRVQAGDLPFNPSRRAFIGGAAAVVAAASIMPVRTPALVVAREMPVAVWLDGKLIYTATDIDVIRRAFVPRLFVQMYEQLPPLQALWDNTEIIASTPVDWAKVLR